MHLLVDLDLVVGQLVLLRELEVECGGLANLELELELGAVLEVEVALLLRGDHITQVVDLLLLQVLEHGIRRHAVRLLGQDTLAVHLLDDAHGHHAGTEARNVGLATVLAQSLLHLGSIICLDNFHAEDRNTTLALIAYNVHSK